MSVNGSLLPNRRHYVSVNAVICEICSVTGFSRMVPAPVRHSSLISEADVRLAGDLGA